jgi:GR25 family glycosyltransferase involved in LPS biosynthesis
MLATLLSAVVVSGNALFAANITRDLKVAFYVNLDRMPSRRAHMEKQLESIGLPARRWSAVDWRDVVNGQFDEILNRQGISAHPERPPKVGNGTVGVFLSHLMALNEARKEVRPHDLVLMMEDDVLPPADWRQRFQSILDRAPEDWQLVKLAGWGKIRPKDAVRDRFGNRPCLGNSLADLVRILNPWHAQVDGQVPTFYAMRPPFMEPSWTSLIGGAPHVYYGGTAAYIVRGSAIESIVRHLHSRPIDDLDGMLLSADLPFYEVWPHPIELSSDAYSGPGLHGWTKGIDETESFWTKGDVPLPRKRNSSGAVPVTSIRVLPNGLAIQGSGHEISVAVKTLLDPLAVEMNPMMRRAAIKPHERSTVDGAFADVATVSVARRGSPSQSKYGHPSWVKNCAMIYLDVGSAGGLQVRKLFEPDRYPVAPILPVFDAYLGAPKDRTLPTEQTGVCALGLDPNSVYQASLRSLQENYTARGWHVHFYPFAAWKHEGYMMFNEAQVRTVSLSEFVKSLPRHSVKFMKVDIGGAEYETVSSMIREKVLCRGVVDAASVQAYPYGDVSRWQDNRTHEAILKRIHESSCGKQGVPSELVDVDDQMYSTDHPEDDIVEWKARTAHARWRESVKMVCFAALFLLAFYVFTLQCRGKPLPAKVLIPVMNLLTRCGIAKGT